MRLLKQTKLRPVREWPWGKLLLFIGLWGLVFCLFEAAVLLSRYSFTWGSIGIAITSIALWFVSSRLLEKLFQHPNPKFYSRLACVFLIALGIVYFSSRSKTEYPNQAAFNQRSQQCQLWVLGSFVGATEFLIPHTLKYLFDLAQDICRIENFAFTMYQDAPQICEGKPKWSCFRELVAKSSAQSPLTLVGYILLGAMSTNFTRGEYQRLAESGLANSEAVQVAALELAEFTATVPLYIQMRHRPSDCLNSGCTLSDNSLTRLDCAIACAVDNISANVAIKTVKKSLVNVVTKVGNQHKKYPLKGERGKEFRNRVQALKRQLASDQDAR